MNTEYHVFAVFESDQNTLLRPLIARVFDLRQPDRQRYVLVLIARDYCEISVGNGTDIRLFDVHSRQI